VTERHPRDGCRRGVGSMIVEGDAGHTDPERHRLLSLDTADGSANEPPSMGAARAVGAFVAVCDPPCPARGESFGSACDSRWRSRRLPARESPAACLAVEISLYRAGAKTLRECGRLPSSIG
jgi:hypothetical protein